MKVLLLILLLSVGLLAQEVTTHYDRFKDVTLVRSAKMPLDANGQFAIVYSNMEVLYSCGFKGQEPKDASFYMTFFSESREWRFLGKSNELTFLVDTKPYAIGKGDRVSDVNTGGRRVSVSERLYYSVTLFDFSKIASAKTVELQIGGFESEFTLGHLNQMNKVIAACTPR